MWLKTLKKQAFLLIVVLGTFTGQVFASNVKMADEQNLQVYLEQVIGQGKARNYKNLDELNRVSAWIKEQMRLLGVPCHYQNFTANQQIYRNVVCSLNVGRADRVIVGAHYDVFGDQDGADDNASGVAGVIETARILAEQKSKLPNNVDFVFYSLEEPPFSKTEQMGSYVHAKSVQSQKDKIKGVYILEMIGFFSEQPIQSYPVGLKWIYPTHGNFIATVSNVSSRDLGAGYCTAMQQLDLLECQRLVAPSFANTFDFSDHLNYWEFDIPAVMITDTAFYRNGHYHTKADRLATLNLSKMANVIDGLVQHLLKP